MPICTYSKAKEGNVQLTKNFKVKEFACKDGSDKIIVDAALPLILQQVRDYFNKPVVVSSAYRTASYNKKIGGVANSQHTKGTAADIYIVGVKAKDIYDYLNKIRPNTGGLGLYVGKNFVHVDTRKTKARWKG